MGSPKVMIMKIITTVIVMTNLFMILILIMLMTMISVQVGWDRTDVKSIRYSSTHKSVSLILDENR